MNSASLNNVITAGANAATSVANSWNDTWQNVLGQSLAMGGSSLYSSLCWLGSLFAVGTLIFLLIEFYRDLNEGKMVALSVLVWPLVVTMLLANKGQLLAGMTLSLRDILNQVNSQVLSITIAGTQLDELYQQANGNIALQGLISVAFGSCQSLSGEAQSQCLSQAVNQSQSYVNSYQSAFGNANWLSGIQGMLTNIGNTITGNNGSPDPGLFALLKPLWMPIVVSVLYWMQIGYQNLLEAGLLLTALFGPIALGGSLLPYGPKSIFAWLTGFFAIGFARICFNIIVGLTAVVATESQGGDPAWFALFAGLFAPLLATGLATGSGFVVWTSVAGGIGNSVRSILGFI